MANAVCIETGRLSERGRFRVARSPRVRIRSGERRARDRRERERVERVRRRDKRRPTRKLDRSRIRGAATSRIGRRPRLRVRNARRVRADRRDRRRPGRRRDGARARVEKRNARSWRREPKARRQNSHCGARGNSARRPFGYCSHGRAGQGMTEKPLEAES